MTEKAQEWKERAQDIAEQARDRARDWQERASDSARQTGRAVHEYVHENAWWSVAAAAVVGCVIGLLIMRSRE